MRIGVLALQGAFELHTKVLENLAQQNNVEVDVLEIRSPKDYVNIDGLIFPGGESTVISKLLKSSGLDEVIEKSIKETLPVLATCAGLILLANHFSCLDCDVERNAYGRQIESFESEVTSKLNDNQYNVSFIRAPKISSVGDNIEVIAMKDKEVVGVRSGNIIALTFHPEVLDTSYFHQLFLDTIIKRVKFEAENTQI